MVYIYTTAPCSDVRCTWHGFRK